MTESSPTLYEVRKGAAWITLNRPERRNALSAQLNNEVYDHLSNAEADADVGCIVITGAGTAFCSGADLKNPPGSAIEGVQSKSYPDVLQFILDCKKPVIAAINGPAFAGGLGLVGASDIAISVDTAKFSFSEVRIGVIPAVISVVCIPKLGRLNAMKLFLTGEHFTASQCKEYGLIHRVVGETELVSAVQEEIDMILLGGPNAVGEAKRLVNEISKISTEEGFKMATPWSAETFRSEEASEGMAAFREKRKAGWVKD